MAVFRRPAAVVGWPEGNSRSMDRHRRSKVRLVGFFSMFECKMSLNWRALGRRSTHAPRSGRRRPLGPETHHRTVSRQFGGADRMFEVDSPPDQTHHCGWTTDCRFAARRTTASARRATGLAQPSLAARRATALDDGRTYPTGCPRPPQWTFSPLCAPPCPHIGTGHKKPTEAGQCQSASRVDSDLNCAACRGLERRP